MKRLYILRHAKSSWAQPGLKDSDRPLNKRGQSQILALAEWFAGRSDAPDLVLCSSAARTRETWQGISSALPDAKFEVLDELYDSTVSDYADALAERDEASIMLIGHNPTCDELARYLTAPSSPEAAALMAAHFGTANLAILDLDIAEWNAMSEASGQLVTMLRPRDILVSH